MENSISTGRDMQSITERIQKIRQRLNWDLDALSVANVQVLHRKDNLHTGWENEHFNGAYQAHSVWKQFNDWNKCPI